MALKRVTPLPKAAARPVQRGAEVKAAAKAAPADDDDRTFTHQGPGTGAAGAVDPQASSATLRSGKGAAPVPEPKGTAPAVEPKTAAPVVESKAAPVETAAEVLRDRLAADRLTPASSGDDDAATTPLPRTPGQQTADSGTAGSDPSNRGAVTGAAATGGKTGGTGAATSDSASGGSGGATPEGANDPFGTGFRGRVDTTMAGALSQMDAARPDLRGGLDVFQSAPGGSSTPSGSGFAGRAGLDGPPAASDPEAEHAADVAGQVTGGRGSTGALFGDRQAGLGSELDVMGGLLADQTARASSPSVAEGPHVGAAAASLSAEIVAGGATAAAASAKIVPVLEGAAGFTVQTGILTEGAAVAGMTAAGVVAAGVVGYGIGSVIEEASHEQIGVVIDAVVEAKNDEDSTAETAAKGKAAFDAGRARKAEREATESSGQSTEPDPNGQSTEPSVGDPGDPNNPDGGMPTPAQIAFRQALRQALGGAQTGSGDIDPADNGGAPVGGSKFGGASNDNLGLIGQPAGTPEGSSGSMHAPTTGTDVDPVEGSAFSGPALGGNPEDLQFGSTTLGLDAARRSTTIEEDDDEDEEDDDD